MVGSRLLLNCVYCTSLQASVTPDFRPYPPPLPLVRHRSSCGCKSNTLLDVALLGSVIFSAGSRKGLTASNPKTHRHLVALFARSGIVLHALAQEHVLYNPRR